jgi:hypothetical protein
MALSPQIQQWAQTAEAQPYLAQTVPQYSGMGGSGMGGYGGGMGGSDYGSYLRELINTNQANPQFQQQMLGQYLDYQNPANQQQLGYTQNQMELGQNELLSSVALSLMSSEDPGAQQRGLAILDSIFRGQVPGYNEAASPTIDQYGYYDMVRQNALNTLQEMGQTGAVDRDMLEWYNFLANASDEQIDYYDQLEGSGKEIFRVKNIFNPDKWRRNETLGYFNQ